MKKIDPLLVKGDGSFFLPMRDEGKVARFSASTFEVLDRWTFEGCPKPSALALDQPGQRLFVACRGKQPRLIVADLESGAVKASLPITRDVNALAWDAGQHRLIIPSGVDANLTLVEQTDVDHYRVLGSVSTLPMAYNMAFDPLSRKVYLPAMDFTLPATAKAKPRPIRCFTPTAFPSPPWRPELHSLSLETCRLHMDSGAGLAA
ncbi:hypothetical protein QNM99_24865 [Pseudomonas sp. PCH446]